MLLDCQEMNMMNDGTANDGGRRPPSKRFAFYVGRDVFIVRCNMLLDNFTSVSLLLTHFIRSQFTLTNNIKVFLLSFAANIKSFFLYCFYYLKIFLSIYLTNLTMTDCLKTEGIQTYCKFKRYY